MLIALPNADGSFTATLFLPRSGPHSFEQLSTGAQARDFFAREFPDALPLIPDLAAQFEAHPQGMLGTIHCPQWRDGERLLLIGDAAHAIVPFHGQGMNCAFEDCRILDGLLARDPANAFAQLRGAAARGLRCHRHHGAGELCGDARHGARPALPAAEGSWRMALERALSGPLHPALFNGDVPRRDPLLGGPASAAAYSRGSWTN